MGKSSRICSREASCEEVVENLPTLRSSLLRFQKVGIATQECLDPLVAHLSSCPGCRQALKESGCAIEIPICEHGTGLDLGTLCLHRT